MTTHPILVLGTGSWATALSMVLATNGHAVVMKAHEASIAAELEQDRENRIFLPGHRFPDTLRVTYDLQGDTLGSALAVVVAVPSQFLRTVVARLARHPALPPLFVIATKGLEEDTGARMSQVVSEVVSPRAVCVLAGPSLAAEVAARQPTTVLAASRDAIAAMDTRNLFHNDRFRVYTSDDPVGVEVGTSLKNVIALAAGIADGMGLGANTRGALLTRGLAEITRLGVALGGRRDTFLGLAGVGDLVTTCSSSLSRNRSLGEAIGRGVTLGTALASMRQVAEGVPTTRSAVHLARSLSVEMPIADAVHGILFEGKEPREALHDLMTRPPREERADG